MNEMRSTQTSRAPFDTDVALTPETLPPIAKPPVSAKRVSLFLIPFVILLATFMPRRFGPTLMASSWFGALLAHFFCFILTLGFCVVGDDLERSLSSGAADLTPITVTRMLIAGAAVAIPGILASIDRWDDWLAVGLFVFAIYAAFWVLGLLLLPWTLGGERKRTTYMRCVKSAYYSTGIIAIIGILTICLFDWLASIDLKDESLAAIITSWSVCWGLWWWRAMIQMAARPVGEAKGPGYEDRPFICFQCGYQIAHLPWDSRCPECGVGVKLSHPDRFKLPAFAAKRWLMRIPAFISTFFASLRSRKFGAFLAVHHGRRQARQYVFGLCIVAGILGAVGFVPMMFLELYKPWTAYNICDEYGATTFCLILGTIVFFSSTAGIWLLLVVFQWLASAFGFAANYRRNIVFCYSASWIMLPILLTIAWGWLLYGHFEFKIFPEHFMCLHQRFAIEALFVLGALCSGLAAFGVWGFKYLRMLKATRFANR